MEGVTVIGTLQIRNFKSIRDLKIKCRRVNILIGEPNTGKSNILEAIGLLSFLGHDGDLGKYVRIERFSNIFYDEDLENEVIIRADNRVLRIVFMDGEFHGYFHKDRETAGEKRLFVATISGGLSRTLEPELRDFKFYRFSVLMEFPGKSSEFLMPPSGDNLLMILLTKKSIRSLVNSIMERYGLRLVLKPQEQKIEVLKQYEDIFISYPYHLASETLQRIIFFITAVMSNRNSIITFEEPEAHAFPYYTKILAEMIARDENNQYFISTHDPYFLHSIIEKTPKDQVNVLITYFKDYETKVKPLSEKDLSEVLSLETDIFFDISKFLEEEHE